MNVKNILNMLIAVFFSVAAMAQRTELKAGETLNPGEPVFSQNGKYVLIMENAVPSGRYGQFSTFATTNFSLARDKGIMSSKPKTNLGKYTTKAQKLVMQTDGNLATYDYQTGRYTWDANTPQRVADPNAKAVVMKVDNDGSVCLYNAKGGKIATIK